MTNDVPAIICDAVEDIQAAGAVQLTHIANGAVAAIAFRCPCGCGRIAAIDFHPALRPRFPLSIAPVLEIRRRKPNGRDLNHWKGFLCDGQWRTLYCYEES